MSHILYETPHMVVSGHLKRGRHLRKEYDERSVPDRSYGIVKFIITLQINGKLAYLELGGDFHKGSPTEETYIDWESIHYVLEQLGYKFQWDNVENSSRDALDKLYELLEYYSEPT